MNKSLKKSDEKIVPTFRENQKVEIHGRLELGMDASLPGSVEGAGGLKFSFKLPTWLSISLFRKLGDYFNNSHNTQ